MIYGCIRVHMHLSSDSRNFGLQLNNVLVNVFLPDVGLSARLGPRLK